MLLRLARAVSQFSSRATSLEKSIEKSSPFWSEVERQMHRRIFGPPTTRASVGPVSSDDDELAPYRERILHLTRSGKFILAENLWKSVFLSGKYSGSERLSDWVAFAYTLNLTNSHQATSRLLGFYELVRIRLPVLIYDWQKRMEYFNGVEQCNAELEDGGNELLRASVEEDARALASMFAYLLERRYQHFEEYGTYWKCLQVYDLPCRSLAAVFGKLYALAADRQWTSLFEWCQALDGGNDGVAAIETEQSFELDGVDIIVSEKLEHVPQVLYLYVLSCSALAHQTTSGVSEAHVEELAHRFRNAKVRKGQESIVQDAIQNVGFNQDFGFVVASSPAE